MNSIFRKLFISGDWAMAYRVSNQHWPFAYETPFIPITNNKHYWYADPLLFEKDGKVFLFCEAFNRKDQKGELAVMEFVNGKWTAPQIIISNNYHMSYPCVFEYHNNYYMIPESAEGGALEMYVSDSFPYVWRKDCNLIKEADLADPTVFCVNDNLFVYTWDERTFIGRIFKLNMEQRECIEVYSKQFQSNSGRPAGYLFKSDDLLLRPSQDSVGMYGKSIIWNELYYQNEQFDEKVISTLDCSQIQITGLKGEKRVHTFSTCGGVEIIDYCEYKFDLFKRLKILYRKYKVHKRNHTRETTY